MSNGWLVLVLAPGISVEQDADELVLLFLLLSGVLSFLSLTAKYRKSFRKRKSEMIDRLPCNRLRETTASKSVYRGMVGVFCLSPKPEL